MGPRMLQIYEKAICFGHEDASQLFLGGRSDEKVRYKKLGYFRLAETDQRPCRARQRRAVIQAVGRRCMDGLTRWRAGFEPWP